MFQIEQDIIRWISDYVVDNIVTFILGIIASLVYFLIRPKASFWFAKQKVKIFRRNLPVVIDSLMSLSIHDTPLDELVHAIDTHLNANPALQSNIMKSNQRDVIEVLADAGDRKIRFEGVISVNVETDEPYAIKFTSENTIVFSNIENYIEILYNIRDRIFETLTQGGMSIIGLPLTSIGVSWRTGQIKLLQWIDYECDLDGFINIPDLDLQIHYGTGRAVISSVAFHPYIKTIIQNIVVESTINK